MKAKLTIKEMCVFSMLGTIMFLSKLVMELLPNIHLVGTLTVVYTLVYRKKALIPIYINVLLVGVYGGFNYWWIPYIYIWTLLWGAVMLLPKSIPQKAKIIVCPLISSLHGFLYGTLYSPAQALMFKLSLKQTIAWIIAGIPFDILHGVGNLILGFLILPLTTLLLKLSREIGIFPPQKVQENALAQPKEDDSTKIQESALAQPKEDNSTKIQDSASTNTQIKKEEL